MKYLSGNGLQHFWQKVKTMIDSKQITEETVFNINGVEFKFTITEVK